MNALNWPDVLTTVVGRTDLSADQTNWAMGEILTGQATPSQIAGFAVALQSKGVTVDEVNGLVEAMFAQAKPLSVPGRSLDIVGTGGDRSFSVNISSMASIVAAGAGAQVVKHGNRSASSKSGSADVLEAMGVRLDLEPGGVAEVAAAAGITFCFAPIFHSALRHAGVPRKELGIATFFNILGPLTNPARPAAAAIGCAFPGMSEVIAGVFARRGVDALVFRGDDGLDELTTTTTSHVWSVLDGEVSTCVLDPRELGVAPATADDLRGGDTAHNADVIRRTLAGEQGPVRDAVVLNAGAALAVFDRDLADVPAAVERGMAKAREAIDSGAASDALTRWVEACARA